MNKIPVLCFLDSPTVETGFGQVAKQILKNLQNTNKYEFTVWGINYFNQPYDQESFPYRILKSACRDESGKVDVYGFEELEKMILSGNYKILFTLNDLHILNKVADMVLKARAKDIPIKWIAYSPLDVAYMTPVLGRCLSVADAPIVYTQFEYDQVAESMPELKDKLTIIYHGTEPETFFPLPSKEIKKLRKEYFGIDDDVFLMINVNRNQWRKDLGRSMYIAKEYHKINPRTMLYLHAKTHDVGGLLMNQASSVGLIRECGSKFLVLTPSEFDPAVGVPRPILNNLYNCANVLLTTTLGEGWGLSLTEAMCAKIPVLGPRNTSLIEILGANEERGWLADCGTTNSEWMIPYGNTDIMRPLVNVDSCVKKLIEIRGMDSGEMELKLYRAMKWAHSLTWAKIGFKWRKIFEQFE
jgi:D-inositol-3-phosphate glycosyltransferase